MARTAVPSCEVGAADARVEPRGGGVTAFAHVLDRGRSASPESCTDLEGSKRVLIGEPLAHDLGESGVRRGEGAAVRDARAELGRVGEGGLECASSRSGGVVGGDGGGLDGEGVNGVQGMVGWVVSRVLAERVVRLVALWAWDAARRTYDLDETLYVP